MSTKYWDLYVYFVKKCERENYINDIDPAHYQMEWNHFWPKCIFGDWPVGNWLTVKQHAIATALQTLAFKRNCLCSWHKRYLAPNLLALAWPYFRKAASKSMKEKIKIIHSNKNENGKSVHAVNMGKIGGKNTHSKKDEDGKSLHAKRIAAIVHAEKDENGKSLHAKKCAAIRDINKHKNKDGKSINAARAAAVTNSQLWQSAVDGFTGNAGSVALHNKANGWPLDARVRLS